MQGGDANHQGVTLTRDKKKNYLNYLKRQFNDICVIFLAINKLHLILFFIK